LSRTHTAGHSVEPGAVGRNWIERGDGRIEPLGSTDSRTVQPGDLFVLETPGGGGFGTPREDTSRQ
jgi:5-oxoprolinase (ATP-hydrolysing)